MLVDDELLGKMIYLRYAFLLEKIIVLNFWKTLTFVDFESFYFGILKFPKGIFYIVKYIVLKWGGAKIFDYFSFYFDVI